MEDQDLALSKFCMWPPNPHLPSPQCGFITVFGLINIPCLYYKPGQILHTAELMWDVLEPFSWLSNLLFPRICYCPFFYLFSFYMHTLIQPQNFLRLFYRWSDKSETLSGPLSLWWRPSRGPPAPPALGPGDTQLLAGTFFYLSFGSEPHLPLFLFTSSFHKSTLSCSNLRIHENCREVSFLEPCKPASIFALPCDG